MAGHSGPFRCECGQIHGAEFQGPSNDLLPYIDTAGVTALNESVRGACQRVFRCARARVRVCARGAKACAHMRECACACALSQAV